MEETMKKLKEEVYINEAMLVGYFWSDPEQYELYDDAVISAHTFLNPVWQFYFGLGRQMSNKGIRVFGLTEVEYFVQESSKAIQKYYEEFNGYETMEVMMNEVKGKEENFDIHFNQVKKYSLIKELIDLFGEKVVTVEGKYDYRKMTKEQLYTYWTDKLNNIGLVNADNGYEEYDLLKGLEKDIEEWSENPSVGLPFYKSPMMTKICTGWDYGNLYILGGFGGSGKSSLVLNKVIMSCLEEKEKLLVIANEQSAKEWKQLLLITAMGVGTHEYINRQRLNEGSFAEQEKQKLKNAVKWIRAITDGDDSLIKFVFMNDYIMDDVKKIIRRYANRGYRRLIIDTGKPSEGGQLQRWERFTEDFKELYKITRANGGGLNLATLVTVQLADGAMTQRFLNEHALGESKKIKNEASVVFMVRAMWHDEYENESHELTCYKFIPKTSEPFSDYEKRFYEVVKVEEKPEDPYKKVIFKIKKEAVHYLLFTAKNRRGADSKTGQDILVLRPNFNNNTWTEIGLTKVFDDRSY